MNNYGKTGGKGERERLTVGRAGRTTGGPVWPCIVTDRELKFDLLLRDRLLSLVTDRRFMRATRFVHGHPAAASVM